MNYYEHHIGDFLKKTAHLSIVEDGIYRRLLDRYYIVEGPLPADVRECCKLARAASRQERTAVADVLREFFELRDDGWHQKRADEEIARYLAKQPEAEAKKENDRERQRRARERRKQLFDDLRNHGIVAPWDATTEQLQDALSRATREAGHAKQSAPVTQPVTRDNTATQSPDTRLHTPDKEERKDTRSARSAPPDRPDDVPEKVWNDFLAIRKAKRAPLTETALDGIAREAAKAGMTLPQALAKCCERGWQGFEAKWVEREPGPPRGRESVSDFNRRSTEEALAMLGNDARTIDA